MSIRGNDPNAFDEMTDEDLALAAVFPGGNGPAANKALTERRVAAAKKTVRLMERTHRYGWGWEPALGLVLHALNERTWGLHDWAVSVPRTGEEPAVYLVPRWLPVLGNLLLTRSKAPKLHGDFFRMCLSWCAAGNEKALEERAKPLAAVIMMTNTRRDMEVAVNRFINEIGY